MKRKPEDITPDEARLRKMTGKNPFQVPDGYFDGFRARLDSRLAEETRPSPSRILSIHSLRWPVAAAAVILVMVTVSVILLRNSHQAEPADIPDFTVTLQDIEEILGMNSFDELTLVDFYLENQADESNDINTLPEKLISDTTIHESDIEQYLLQSNELENLLLNL